MSGTREKFNAVFFAAVMVLSMVAMSAAFAAPAAAIEDGAITVDEVDATGNTTTNDLAEYNINVTIDTGTGTDGESIVIEDSGGANFDLSTVSNAEVLYDGSNITDSISSQTADRLVIDTATTNYDPTTDDTANVTLTGVTNGDTPGDYTVDVEFTSDSSSENSGAVGTADVTIDPSLNVEGLTAPRTIAQDAEMTVTATVSNDGGQETTAAIDYVDDSAVANIEDNSGGASVEDQGTTTLAPGESTSVEVVIDASTGNFNQNIPSTFAHGIQVSDGTGAFESGQGALLTVGESTNFGQITANIQDSSGNDLNGATVEIYKANDWDGDPADSTPFETAELGSTENTVTFENLAMGVSGSSTTEDYVLRSTKEDFNSRTTQVALEEPDNEGPTETLTLSIDAEPNVLGLGAWDPEEERVVSDASSLFADGSFDNQAELVVFAQTDTESQDLRPLQDDLDVTISTTSTGDDIVDAYIVDNQTAETNTSSITVTINGSSPTANVDGNATTGDFSYETFNITANETDALLENAGEPVANEVLKASAPIEGNDVELATELSDQQVTDQSGTPVENDVTFFLEGEKASQHQVVDTNGDPVSGATVYVAYTGGVQDLDEIQNFQNNAGESFLVATTNEDGIAVIPGIADDTPYNVYVTADGFNIFNSSEAEASGGSDLSDATGLEGNTFVADYTLDTDINEADEGSGFPAVYSHTLRQTTQDIAIDLTVADADGTQVKSTEVPSGDTREIEVNATAGEVGQDVADFDALSEQTIDVELTDDTAGSLVGADDEGVVQVITDENGTATVTFQAVEDQSRTTNVTASTLNSNNDLYATEDDEGQGVNDDGNQAEIEVFTSGKLTGDVLDQNEDPIPFANVSLSVFNATSGEYEQIRDEKTISGSGQYVFEDLPTNEEYRVNGEFEGDTGFATITDLNPGTNTRDVVISEALAPAGFTVSDLNAPSEASPGEQITVSANITNLGGSTATDTVEFRLAGNTVQDESLTLGSNEQQSVSFDVTVPDVEDGNYTHGIFTSDFDQTATLTVTDQGADQGTDEELARFDDGDDGIIDRGEAVDAIVAYNSDGTIGGEEVTREQAVQVIIAYNSGQTVAA